MTTSRILRARLEAARARGAPVVVEQRDVAELIDLRIEVRRLRKRLDDRLLSRGHLGPAPKGRG